MLCKYSPERGAGVPREVEDGAFEPVFSRHARGSGLSARQYQSAYEGGEILNAELDDYFAHDAGVR